LKNSSLVPEASRCALNGTLCGRGDYKMVSMFWMRARIEAAPHQVKRATRVAGGGRDCSVPAEIPDFAFDLNHINVAFGSDMVKEWFFRYVRRGACRERGCWFQGTYL
jgi:hypothetical protein